MAPSQKKKPSMCDLEGQLVFYASYHNHPVNIGIHILCIWNILWTLNLFLQYTPDLVATPDWFLVHCRINLALITVIFYSIVYVVMEPLVGLIGKKLVLLSTVRILHQSVAYLIPCVRK